MQIMHTTTPRIAAVNVFLRDVILRNLRFINVINCNSYYLDFTHLLLRRQRKIEIYEGSCVPFLFLFPFVKCFIARMYC